MTDAHVWELTRDMPAEWDWVQAWLTPDRAREVLDFDGTWREIGEHAHWCWGAPTGSQHMGDLLVSESVAMVRRLGK
jgi:hypothetical protein